MTQKALPLEERNQQWHIDIQQFASGRCAAPFRSDGECRFRCAAAFAFHARGRESVPHFSEHLAIASSRSVSYTIPGGLNDMHTFVLGIYGVFLPQGTVYRYGIYPYHPSASACGTRSHTGNIASQFTA